MPQYCACVGDACFSAPNLRGIHVRHDPQDQIEGAKTRLTAAATATVRFSQLQLFSAAEGRCGLSFSGRCTGAGGSNPGLLDPC